MPKAFLLDPEAAHTISSPAGRLLNDTLASVGMGLSDCWIGTSDANALDVLDEVDLVVCLGTEAARMIFGKGTKSEYKVPNGKGKKGQDLFREPTLTELRRRSDLVWGPKPVQVIVHPSSALARSNVKSMFIRDCQQVAERVGARQAVDQTRDYAEHDPKERVPERVDGSPVALDTEFTQAGDLYCWSYSYRPGWGRVVMADGFAAKHEMEHALHFAGKILLHNAKADVPVVCKWLGWAIEDWPWDKTEDTICQAYVLGYKPLSLKALAESLLELKVIRLEEIVDEEFNLESIPREDLIRYSCQDSDLTLRLYNRFKAELSAS